MTGEQPSLRERQAAQVRQDLRSAFVRLLVRRGPHGFTLADVATEAGVSERTLYRHYANREALVEAFFEEEASRIGVAVDRRVADQMAIDTDPELVATIFEVFAGHHDILRAAQLLRTATEGSTGTAQRTRGIRDALAGSGAYDDAVVEQLTAVLRLLTSSDAWLRLAEPDLAMPPRAAGEAVQWAAQVLLAAAREANGPLRPHGPEGGA